jgi:hypothetical protein
MFRCSWPLDRPLFQSRFASVAMDESHLRAAVSYVILNPARARLVSRAKEWSWSRVWAHLTGEDDTLASVRHALDLMAGCVAPAMFEVGCLMIRDERDHTRPEPARCVEAFGMLFS